MASQFDSPNQLGFDRCFNLQRRLVSSYFKVRFTLLRIEGRKTNSQTALDILGLHSWTPAPEVPHPLPPESHSSSSSPSTRRALTMRGEGEVALNAARREMVLCLLTLSGGTSASTLLLCGRPFIWCLPSYELLHLHPKTGPAMSLIFFLLVARLKS